MFPEKLGRPPLIEALFEVRFDAGESAGELLPGLLYSSLKSSYDQVESLPVSNVPMEIRNKEPRLRYATSHKLSGKDGSAVQVGHRVAQYVTAYNYPGWIRFKEQVMRLAEALKATGLITVVERCALKYTNVIPVGTYSSQLDLLQARIEVLGKPIENVFSLRCERLANDIRTILNIKSNAVVERDGKVVGEGLYLDVDTIMTLDMDSFWKEAGDRLETVHGAAKSTFFSLLTNETLASMKPEGQS